MRRVVGILVASLALGALLLWGVGRFSPVATAGTAREEVGGAVVNLAVAGMTSAAVARGASVPPWNSAPVCGR